MCLFPSLFLARLRLQVSGAQAGDTGCGFVLPRPVPMPKEGGEWGVPHPQRVVRNSQKKKKKQDAQFNLHFR